MSALPRFSIVWDEANYEWILCDDDGDELSRHRWLIDAEMAAANREPSR